MFVLNQSERSIRLGRVSISPGKHADVPESILWQGKAQSLRRQGTIKFPFHPDVPFAPNVEKVLVKTDVVEGKMVIDDYAPPFKTPAAPATTPPSKTSSRSRRRDLKE